MKIAEIDMKGGGAILGKIILKQRKYLSPRFHTMAPSTEYTFHLVLISIFGFPYLGIKTHFFSKLNLFSGGKYLNFMTRSPRQKGILWRHISKTRKATRLKFCIGHAFMAIDSCKVSFQSVDGKLDFWHPGLWATPRLGKRLKRPGLIGLNRYIVNSVLPVIACFRRLPECKGFNICSLWYTVGWKIVKR